jgi:hypothetical protein
LRSILLRGIHEKLFNEIKRKSDKESLSMNKFIISLLESNLDFTLKQKKVKNKYNDLENLFGKWNSNEYEAIKGVLKNQREIDKEQWK